MRTLLLVAAGGALGSTLRINVAGSFVLAYAAGSVVLGIAAAWLGHSLTRG